MEKQQLRNRASRAAARLIGLGALMVILALTAGCPGKTDIKPVGRPGDTGQVTPPVTLPEKVEPKDPKTAYAQGDYETAESLAAEWTSRPDLSRDELLEAWQYYAMAAVKNQHGHLAATALDKWLQMEPALENTAVWQDTWLGAYALYPKAEARQYALDVLQSQRGVAFKNRAAMLLALTYESPEELGRLLVYAQQMYQLLDQSNAAAAEKAWAGQLREVSAAQLKDLDDQAQLSGNTAYPYILIRLETAFRMLDNPASGAAGQDLLTFLQVQASLADRSLLNPPTPEARPQDAGLSGSPLTMPVGSEQSVTLLLPMGGAFAPISAKISNGADIARQELARTGYTVHLNVINTDDPGWLQQLAATPSQVIIGGPLQSAAFAQAKGGNLLPGRAMFTFLPQLDPGDEGRTAWRFYTSSKDQVDAVLLFCRDVLGITSVASLYPDDSYGERMNDTFASQAGALGLSVARSQVYPAGNQAAWNDLSAGFLGVRRTNPPMDPSPPFEAVFMPDSWANASAMAAYLHYHMEDREVLLGTTIWEQGLSSGRNVDAQYFNLGVFPSAWNYTIANPAQQALNNALAGQAGFWEGLGYDFVRFASRLGSPEGGQWTPETVNNRVASAQNMNWSIAQMQWDAQGQCRQHLFLYTPTQTSFAPVDPARFKALRENIIQQHTARMRGTR